MNAQLAEAERLLAEGRPRVAGLVLEALAARMPGSAQVALVQARALRACGATLGAAQAAERAHRLFPAHAQAAGFWASLLLEQGRIGQAACVLDRAIEAGAADPALDAMLAAALLELREPAAAAQAASRGLASFPGDAELQRWAARAAGDV